MTINKYIYIYRPHSINNNLNMIFASLRMYGIFLHQLFVKDQIARKWPVQAYDPALDPRKTSPDVENPVPAVPAAPAAPVAPAQEVMAESNNNTLPGQIEGTK
jgi:hypothetical protein